ncbi:MAG TPA: DUF397 domain-containing protein [Actinospica sp.]|jgi:hypothetical protein|nr:DUF397 domain-containing protein [Actinospica sp.]
MTNTHIPLAWRKAASCTSGASCVEIADLPDGGAAMRDSKCSDSPELHFSASEWAGFITAVRAGEFDSDSRN